MSNSPLAVTSILSPNFNTRTKKIRKITIHHAAGILSAENLAKIFSPVERQASANYVIGNDGKIILVVPEDKRAWTSNSASNDQESVTIEVSNSAGAPEWKISDAAYNALLNLCTDICERNEMSDLIWTGGKDGTLTCHYMFVPTACPGPYLKGKMPEIAKTVTERLNKKNESTTPAVTPTTPSTDTTSYPVGYEMSLNGINLYSSSSSTRRASTVNGTYYLWSNEVLNNRVKITNSPKNVGVSGQVTGWINESDIPKSATVTPPKKKTVTELAQEVIDGQWGVGEDRKKRLTEAGHDYNAVQAEVNRILKSSTTQTTTISNGNSVKFKSSAKKWATGENIPSWVKSKVLYVRSNPSNGKCQVSTQKTGAITGIALVSDLTRV